MSVAKSLIKGINYLKKSSNWLTNNPIWKFFSSINAGITLLSIIAIASCIGTIIPQDLTKDEYLSKYSREAYDILNAFKLTTLFHSWWFITLLVLLILNLAVATINRFSFKLKSIGFLITHSSIIIIIIGAIIGNVNGERGFLWLKEGETKSTFSIGDVSRKLNFNLRLKDFILEHYNSDSQKITVSVVKEGKSFEYVYPVEIGKEYNVQGTDYKIKMLRYVPDFVIDIETKEAVTRTDEPNNPALQVEIISPEGNVSNRWLFARYPGMHGDKEKDIEIVYHWAQERIKDFKSELEVLEGDRLVQSKMIEVNHPLEYKGYVFYQASYNPQDLTVTGLQVTKDPGVPVVYTGFIMLVGGLVVVFYINPLLRIKK
ncbi:MAG: cytochrome c biogenesis protein ResB [Candidatus Omnitrophica bacterium]|nr:cytochrome c biogenesis protein ResB [Candidatus Omnitrophota bacterium]